MAVAVVVDILDIVITASITDEHLAVDGLAGVPDQEANLLLSKIRIGFHQLRATGLRELCPAGVDQLRIRGRGKMALLVIRICSLVDLDALIQLACIDDQTRLLYPPAPVSESDTGSVIFS